MSAPDDDPLDRARRAVEDPRFDVVSFDVFDTLLVRPVLEPNDLFRLVGLRAAADGLLTDFATLRPRAEALARRRLRERDPARDEPDMASVHAALADLAGLSADTIARLASLEVSVERRILRPRPALCALFETARRLGRRILVVSDSCADPAFVAERLREAAGLVPDHLHVSSTTGLTKASGRLFAAIRDDLGLDPARWLHIGDNDLSDGRRPRELGITAALVPRPTEFHFERAAALDLWASDRVEIDVAHRLLLGMSLAGPLDRPPSSPDDPEAWGHALLGPLLVAETIRPTAPARSPLAELIAVARSSADAGWSNPDLSALFAGARRAAAEAERLFAADLALFRLDVDRLLVPIARARAGAIPDARRWFDHPLFDRLLAGVPRDAVAGLDLVRRAELRWLSPRLTVNARQRLVTDAPRFFRETRRPWLRLWARLRPFLTGGGRRRPS
jgi:FMN phosphatase YigB (HAD superfamily)